MQVMVLNLEIIVTTVEFGKNIFNFVLNIKIIIKFYHLFCFGDYERNDCNYRKLIFLIESFMVIYLIVILCLNEFKYVLLRL